MRGRPLEAGRGSSRRRRHTDLGRLYASHRPGFRGLRVDHCQLCERPGSTSGAHTGFGVADRGRPKTSEEPSLGFFTERLEVRRLVMSDLAEFHEVWGDPRVIFWGATEDLDATRERLRDFIHRGFADLADSGWFAVVRRADGQFLGDVVLEPASWNHDMPEIGWHFAKEWQGLGYATVAAAGLLEFAAQHGVPAVYAKILRTNAASQGVARRIGMTVLEPLDHPTGPHDIWVKPLEDSVDG